MAGITIKDLAKLAGVAHTTVSRALNDNPLICEETKTLIKGLARKHGYVPNNFAKSLVTKKSFNIGLFFSSIGSNVTASFFHETSTVIQKVIKDKYNLIIRGIDDFAGDFSSVNRRSFDGILLVSQKKNDDTFIRYLVSSGIPVVVINRNVRSMKIDCFFSDEKGIVRDMVMSLAGNGHRRIAFIKGAPDSISAEERYSGYLEAIYEITGKNDSNLVFEGDYTVESGYAAGRKILGTAKKPSAVICSNDNMAIGLIKYFNDNSIRVPEDISVTGFDNTEISGFILPSLTTIERPVGRIVEAAARRIIDILDKKNRTGVPVSKCFESKLIIRKSIHELK